MAAIDTSRSVFAHSTSANRHTVSFASKAAAIVTAVASWNDARVTRKALNALSDRELEDIGLSRGDIDTIAERSV